MESRELRTGDGKHMSSPNSSVRAEAPLMQEHHRAENQHAALTARSSGPSVKCPQPHPGPWMWLDAHVSADVLWVRGTQVPPPAVEGRLTVHTTSLSTRTSQPFPDPLCHLRKGGWQVSAASHFPEVTSKCFAPRPGCNATWSGGAPGPPPPITSPADGVCLPSAPSAVPHWTLGPGHILTILPEGSRFTEAHTCPGSETQTLGTVARPGQRPLWEILAGQRQSRGLEAVMGEQQLSRGPPAFTLQMG